MENGCYYVAKSLKNAGSDTLTTPQEKPKVLEKQSGKYHWCQVQEWRSACSQLSDVMDTDGLRSFWGFAVIFLT